MRRLCKNCIYWQRTLLSGQGYCSREKKYRNSLYICSLFEGRPPSIKEWFSSLLGFFWEKSGQPFLDAATTSRKSLEMLILFTFMLIAFVVMTVTVYPMVKKVASQVFMTSVTAPGDN